MITSKKITRISPSKNVRVGKDLRDIRLSKTDGFQFVSIFKGLIVATWALHRRDSQATWLVLAQQETVLGSISDVCHGHRKGKEGHTCCLFAVFGYS